MSNEWSVTEEAVTAMQTAVTSLQETMEGLKKEVQQLKVIYEENEDGLGAHSQSISKLVDELESIAEEANNPVKILILKLTKAAMIRSTHINTNNYTTSKSR